MSRARKLASPVSLVPLSLSLTLSFFDSLFLSFSISPSSSHPRLVARLFRYRYRGSRSLSLHFLLPPAPARSRPFPLSLTPSPSAPRSSVSILPFGPFRPSTVANLPPSRSHSRSFPLLEIYSQLRRTLFYILLRPACATFVLLGVSCPMLRRFFICPLASACTRARDALEEKNGSTECLLNQLDHLFLE